ncbi:MAG: RNA 2',3'-cyclic phosphodiesterase [Acidobacteriota bacterium]|nr:RNA 2',3'-cyclic phosphodiesterase [Acidobacteriota bacterium]
MRIFAAIDISVHARRQASKYIERLGVEFPYTRVSWTKPEKLHLTLKFLGETDDEQLRKFTEAVEQTAKKVSPFDLQICGAGVFPSARNARVLWLGVSDENNNLRKLSEILETQCERRGFAREDRRFKAHLTIARLKQRPDELLIREHLNSIFPPFPPFQASEITIYASKLQPQGSIYETISKHKFYLVNTES